MAKIVGYKSQLLDQRWLEKRVLILKRDRFKCKKCQSTNNLHIHHKFYITGRQAWEYPDTVLVTLCNLCHAELHKKTKIVTKKDFTPKLKRPKKPKTKVIISRLKKADIKAIKQNEL